MNAQNEILTPKQIATVFSIFHDGTIEAWQGNHNMLVLKINCLYLAELMHPTFEYFYLEIFDLQSIELTRWLNDGAKLNERSTELHEIFADELEVITADEKLDLISIVCMQLDKKVDFSGGILAIRCGGGRLFNHNHQALGLEKLIELANGYWGKV